MDFRIDKIGHIEMLDGMRAYAVLLVCIVHFFQVDENGLYLTNKVIGIILFKLSQLGLKGVDLFFILSGFLITRILIRSKKSPKYFTSFYARRFIRIFPVYYFVLIISFIVLPRFISVDGFGESIIHRQSWLWTYTSNLTKCFGFEGWDKSLNFPSFGHFWSLCVEEHFYLLWPALIYFSSNKWLPFIMKLIVSLSVVSVIFVAIFGNIVPILGWTTINYVGVLSLGALIAWYFERPDKFDVIFSPARKYLLPSFILFILVGFIPRKYGIYSAASYVVTNLFFFFLFIVTVKGNNITNKIFGKKVLYFIGKISYGVYVYHGILRPYFKSYFYEGILVHFFNGIVASIIYTVLCTAISIAIAWVSWEVLENPILKLKKQFTYN